MSYKRLLQDSVFRLLCVGQVLSSAGNALGTVALLWYASTVLGSPLLVGLVGAASMAPSVFGVMAGSVSDRMDRRVLMMASDAIRGGLVVLLAAVVAAGRAPVGTLLGLVFMLGLAGTFFTPAMYALLPSLVDRTDLASANALLGTTQQGALAAGAALGGAGVVMVGAPGVLLADAGTFLCSLLTLAAMRRSWRFHVYTADQNTDSSRDEQEARFHLGGMMRRQLVDLRAGVEMMWRSPLIRQVIPVALPANAAYVAVLVLLPLWVRTILHASPSVYGFVVSAGMFGLMTGTLIAPRLAARYSVGRVMGVTTVMEAGALLCFTLTTDPGSAAIWYGLVGLFDGLSSPVYFSLVQSRVPNAYLGRVFGGLMTCLALGQPVGMIFGGLFARSLGMTDVYTGAAILVALAGVYFLVAAPLRARLTTPSGVLQRDMDDLH